jgi:hypothetical protein
VSKKPDLNNLSCSKNPDWAHASPQMLITRGLSILSIGSKFWLAGLIPSVHPTKVSLLTGKIFVLTPSIRILDFKPEKEIHYKMNVATN